MNNAHEVSVSRVIPADPEEIFAVVSHTDGHVAMDGSGSVKSAVDSQRLTMGSKFGMSMRIGLPYRMSNTVVEFEPDRLIAWRHFGRHVWRYELEPADGGTEVTETFDWSGAHSRRYIEWFGWPARNKANMVETLDRLEAEVLRRRPTNPNPKSAE